MLVNLSNHPFAQWSLSQQEASAAYGEVIDLPFPAVSPYADEEEIAHMADEYTAEVMALGNPEDITVHLMGEQTLCVAILSRLARIAISCIASCSARDVQMQPDGSKLVNFHFTRFRKYKL